MPARILGDMAGLLEYLDARMMPNTTIYPSEVSELVSGNSSLYSHWKTRMKGLPAPQLIARFTRELRRLLLQREEPLARTTTVARAFVAAGLMEEEDLAPEETSPLDLNALSAQDQATLLAFYSFLRSGQRCP